jgi:hypothetical protein
MTALYFSALTLLRGLLAPLNDVVALYEDKIHERRGKSYPYSMGMEMI